MSWVNRGDVEDLDLDLDSVGCGICCRFACACHCHCCSCEVDGGCSPDFRVYASDGLSRREWTV